MLKRALHMLQIDRMRFVEQIKQQVDRIDMFLLINLWLPHIPNCFCYPSSSVVLELEYVKQGWLWVSVIMSHFSSLYLFQSSQLQNNQIYKQGVYQYANPSKRLEKIKGDVLSCVKSLTVVNRKKTTFLTSNLLDFMAIKTLPMRANEQSTKNPDNKIMPNTEMLQPSTVLSSVPMTKGPSKGLLNV